MPAYISISTRSPIPATSGREKHTAQQSPAKATSLSDLSSNNTSLPLDEIMPAKRSLSDIEDVSGDLAETESESRDSVTGEKRKFENDDDAEVPMIPVRGRRKRQREWVWTLGALTTAGLDTDDIPETAEPTRIIDNE
ncbi:MAG: hypothetical protein M1830_006243 [Pleopsidium flavum]|nr:MAG: hypothetical protein M1830_006243 [Pleopsidium flavum]